MTLKGQLLFAAGRSFAHERLAELVGGQVPLRYPELKAPWVRPECTLSSGYPQGTLDIGPFLIYSKARALAWGLEKPGICLFKKDHPRVSRHSGS